MGPLDWSSVVNFYLHYILYRNNEESSAPEADIIPNEQSEGREDDSDVEDDLDEYDILSVQESDETDSVNENKKTENVVEVSCNSTTQLKMKQVATGPRGL